jgi:hypothetical protein
MREEQASVVIKFTQIQSWLFPLQKKVPKIVASSESKALRYRQILAKPAGFAGFWPIGVDCYRQHT